jgi:hypothetical protein
VFKIRKRRILRENVFMDENHCQQLRKLERLKINRKKVEHRIQFLILIKVFYDVCQDLSIIQNTLASKEDNKYYFQKLDCIEEVDSCLFIHTSSTTMYEAEYINELRMM